MVSTFIVTGQFLILKEWNSHRVMRNGKKESAVAKKIEKRYFISDEILPRSLSKSKYIPFTKSIFSIKKNTLSKVFGGPHINVLLWE